MKTSFSTAPRRTNRGDGDDGASVAGSELFDPDAPSILMVQSLLDLKANHGVQEEIEMVIRDPSHSPELVKPGYCCTYAPYFSVAS